VLPKTRFLGHRLSTRSGARRLLQRLVGGGLAVAVVAAGLVVGGTVAAPETASAASASDFDAGYIISDYNFYNSSALTRKQIQTFLGKQSCAPLDSSPCLADYTQKTKTRSPLASDSAVYCKTYTGAASESAATIIHKVAKACGISPEVILVTLQKEENLLSTPSAGRYKIAMGYACPDTAACDSTYFGFFNQVYAAAKQWKRYAMYQPTTYWSTKVGTNAVKYNPKASCGTKTVDVQNQATASLYNYTPYTPNAAALGNLYGVGNSCSSYGNRNFWVYYSDWFGSPTSGTSLVSVGGAVYLLSGRNAYHVSSPAMLAQLADLGKVKTVTAAYLSTYTVQEVGSYSPVYTSSVSDTYYELSGKALHAFSSASAVTGAGYDPATAIQLTPFQVKKLGTGAALGSYLRIDGSSTIYLDRAGVLAPLQNRATAKALNGGTTPPIRQVTAAAAAGRTIGANVLMRPGTAIRNRGKLYLVNGASSKIRLSKIGVLRDLGVKATVTRVSDATADAYATAAGSVRPLVRFSGKTYIATGHGVAKLGTKSGTGIQPTAVTASTGLIFRVKARSVKPTFVRNRANGHLYRLVHGVAQRISSAQMRRIDRTPSVLNLGAASVKKLPKE
jgi:hypothetical protein